MEIVVMCVPIAKIQTNTQATHPAAKDDHCIIVGIFSSVEWCCWTYRRDYKIILVSSIGDVR